MQGCTKRKEKERFRSPVRSSKMSFQNLSPQNIFPLSIFLLLIKLSFTEKVDEDLVNSRFDHSKAIIWSSSNIAQKVFSELGQNNCELFSNPR